jgi:deferrochelatase/peroxidase EfeB
VVRGLPHGAVDGSRATGGDGDPIATGELLLGYRNEAGIVVGPTWMKNGTFLVFRQLEQLVGTFWKYMHDHCGPKSPDHLAAKLVGRWRSGAPLALCPSAPIEALDEVNDFSYAESDPRGLRCPIGAHIARSNPRDRLVDMPADRAIALTRMRLLMRRGRPYGAPLRSDFDFARMTYAELEEAARAESSGPPPARGLNFICLNANIELQFEFVMHSWVHNPKFGGLQGDPDPIVGERRSQSCSYTIQTETLPQRIQLARFVRLRGGGYFFLPGLRTLRLLCGAAP